MDAIYANARFDDLDLGAKSQLVDKIMQKINFACFRQLSVTIKLATTVSLFILRDLAAFVIGYIA